MESSDLSQILILKHISGNKILECVPKTFLALSRQVSKNFPDLDDFELSYQSSEKIEKSLKNYSDYLQGKFLEFFKD